MIAKIIDQLSKKGLSGWQVRWIHKKSNQSFLALEKLECRRQGETETFVISIYKKKPTGSLGLSTFKITPANEGSLEKELDQARDYARELYKGVDVLPTTETVAYVLGAKAETWAR